MRLGTVVFIIWVLIIILPESYGKLGAKIVKAYNVEMEKK